MLNEHCCTNIITDYTKYVPYYSQCFKQTDRPSGKAVPEPSPTTDHVISFFSFL